MYPYILPILSKLVILESYSYIDVAIHLTFALRGNRYLLIQSLCTNLCHMYGCEVASILDQA